MLSRYAGEFTGLDVGNTLELAHCTAPEQWLLREQDRLAKNFVMYVA